MANKHFKEEEISLQATSRYIRQNMNKAMRGDIVRGICELITNSDDSYKRLEEKGLKIDGGIVVEIERKRSGSIIRVRDRAEGMSFDDMKTKITRLGGRTSGFEGGKAIRGLHGRGAKDIVDLGPVEFESIKDDAYTKLSLSPNTNGKVLTDDVDEEIRERLKIKRNGTVVTINAHENIRIPLHNYLHKEIANYYSLRDICSNNSRRILLIDINSSKTDRITYKYPEGGELVYSQTIKLTQYPEASASINIKKFNKTFERSTSPYREGILIKSNGAIHGCKYFGLEPEPIAWRFSGEVVCGYIDNLVQEFDDREEKGEYKHPSNNPMRIINPDRDGLIEEHPFTKELYKECKRILGELIESVRMSEGANRRDVANANLLKKLEDLSRQLSSLYEQDLSELEEENEMLNTGDYSRKFPLGLHVIPSGTHDILKGKKKTFSVIYIGNDNIDSSMPVKVSSNNNKVKLDKNYIYLEKNYDSTSGKGTFTVEGLEENNQATLTIVYKAYQRTINVRVVEVENLYQMPDGLFFDKNKTKYYIVYGKHKEIDIYLNTNRYLANKIVWVSSSQPSDVVILGGSAIELNPTVQKNLHKGTLKLEGRRNKSSAIITAKLDGYNSISANVVVENRDKSGIHFEYIPTEEDFGILRYKWDLTNKTKLFIGAKHPSIRRYLGELLRNQYTGIDSPLYLSVLAEVIASAHAFEILKKKFIREGEAGKLDFDTTNNFYHASFT